MITKKITHVYNTISLVEKRHFKTENLEIFFL